MFRRHFISRRLHFRVLYGINQFQNQSSRIWYRFKPEGSGFFEYMALKTSFKTGFICLKPVYTKKYSKMRWSEMAPEHPSMVRPLRGRPFIVTCFESNLSTLPDMKLTFLLVLYRLLLPKISLFLLPQWPHFSRAIIAFSILWTEKKKWSPMKQTQNDKLCPQPVINMAPRTKWKNKMWTWELRVCFGNWSDVSRKNSKIKEALREPKNPSGHPKKTHSESDNLYLFPQPSKKKTFFPDIRENS